MCACCDQMPFCCPPAMDDCGCCCYTDLGCCEIPNCCPPPCAPAPANCCKCPEPAAPPCCTLCLPPLDSRTIYRCSYMAICGDYRAQPQWPVDNVDELLHCDEPVRKQCMPCSPCTPPPQCCGSCSCCASNCCGC